MGVGGQWGGGLVCPVVGGFLCLLSGHFQDIGVRDCNGINRHTSLWGGQSLCACPPLPSVLPGKWNPAGFASQGPMCGVVVSSGSQPLLLWRQCEVTGLQQVVVVQGERESLAHACRGLDSRLNPSSALGWFTPPTWPPPRTCPFSGPHRLGRGMAATLCRQQLFRSSIPELGPGSGESVRKAGLLGRGVSVSWNRTD